MDQTKKAKNSSFGFSRATQRADGVFPSGGSKGCFSLEPGEKEMSDKATSPTNTAWAAITHYQTIT